MIIILNNNIDHAITITEGHYDHINHEFHMKNHNLTAWSDEVINYLVSLANTTITTITIKNDNEELLKTYENLNCRIQNLSDTFQEYPPHIVISRDLDIS